MAARLRLAKAGGTWLTRLDGTLGRVFLAFASSAALHAAASENEQTQRRSRPRADYSSCMAGEVTTALTTTPAPSPFTSPLIFSISQPITWILPLTPSLPCHRSPACAASLAEPSLRDRRCCRALREAVWRRFSTCSLTPHWVHLIPTLPPSALPTPACASLERHDRRGPFTLERITECCRLAAIHPRAGPGNFGWPIGRRRRPGGASPRPRPLRLRGCCSRRCRRCSGRSNSQAEGWPETSESEAHDPCSPPSSTDARARSTLPRKSASSGTGRLRLHFESAARSISSSSKSPSSNMRRACRPCSTATAPPPTSV